MRPRRARTALPLLLALAVTACNGSGSPARPAFTGSVTLDTASVRLQVTQVAGGLDTVWALAWDGQGRLWWTERGGRLTRLGQPPTRIAGVQEAGEGGLMGLEIDDRGRFFVMYTSDRDNRVVALRPDGSQRVLVDGIEKAGIHNGGRLRFGPDGMLYVGTGDAAQGDLAQRDDSLNGKILRIDPDGGRIDMVSKGRRNPQGLCFAPGGQLWSTEHGPDQGDEIDVVVEGSNGGWPDSTGTGRKNYTPTIAPGGCEVYAGDRFPQWRGSLLFVTLKDQSLRRLTLGSGGEVAGEEVLLAGRFGRLRDVRTGPDGAVYLVTSNRDGRGTAAEGDDRILRLVPA